MKNVDYPVMTLSKEALIECIKSCEGNDVMLNVHRAGLQSISSVTNAYLMSDDKEKLIMLNGSLEAKEELKIYKVKMNNGDWGCLSDAIHHFIIKATSREEAEKKVRDANERYQKPGKYVEYAWDALVSELDFDKNGFLNRL